LGLFFIYANYLFFFDKDRKNPKVKSGLWKMLLVVYSLLGVMILLAL